MQFGEYIRRRRLELGWTQPDAAARAGIEQSYLSKLEGGKAIPSAEVYRRLVDAFGLATEDMVGVLSPAELDRLRPVEPLQAVRRSGARRARAISHRWLLAGLASLVLGGGLVSLAEIGGGDPVRQFTYQSTGVIRPGESLDVFAALDDEPDPEAADHAGRISRRDALIRRVDDQTRSLAVLKGPAFIESAPGGKRIWRLVGSSEVAAPARYRWAAVPGWALLLGALGCFFISWRWPRAGAAALPEKDRPT